MVFITEFEVIISMEHSLCNIENSQFEDSIHWNHTHTHTDWINRRGIRKSNYISKDLKPPSRKIFAHLYTHVQTLYSLINSKCILTICYYYFVHSYIRAVWLCVNNTWICIIMDDLY